MKRFNVVVNGKAYDVAVEELGAGAAPGSQPHRQHRLQQLRRLQPHRQLRLRQRRLRRLARARRLKRDARPPFLR